MSIFNSLQSLLAQTPEVPAPEEIAQTWQQKLSALSSLSFQQFMEQAISAILHGAVKIAIALAVFFIGKWIINRIYHFISKAFIRRNVELSLRTFLLSLIRIILIAYSHRYRDRNTRYQHQFVFSHIRLCRTCHRYGFERYASKLRRRGHDTSVQTL